MKPRNVTFMLILFSLLTLSMNLQATVLQTQIHIHASPAQVWKVLTDFEQHSVWNPFIRRIEGEPRTGTQLKVIVQSGPVDQIEFQPIILRSDPESELRWLGTLWGLDYLFSGEHYFLLKREPDGTTMLIHGEQFGGALLTLLGEKFKKDTLAGFRALNLALKRRVESQVELATTMTVSEG